MVDLNDEPQAVPSVDYYDTGAVRNRGLLLDGQMHGEWVFLRKDGSVMRTGRLRPRPPGGRVANLRPHRASS